MDKVCGKLENDLEGHHTRSNGITERKTKHKKK